MNLCTQRASNGQGIEVKGDPIHERIMRGRQGPRKKYHNSQRKRAFNNTFVIQEVVAQAAANPDLSFTNIDLIQSEL